MVGSISFRWMFGPASLGFILAYLLQLPLQLPRLSFIPNLLISQRHSSVIGNDPLEGLSLLFEGSNAELDIVFVHGLNGHRERTWTSSNGTFWPRDLLPHDLPRTRIYSWGYDARALATSQISDQDLHGHGQALVEDLSLERKETKTVRRPIVFMAHSLGGLIVKSALIHSESTKPGHLKDDRAIKLSTRSVYFFGTPHRGGKGVDMGLLLVRIGAVAFNKNEKLLQHLAQDSERLRLLTEQFLPLVDDFEIISFYETKNTELPGGTSMKIVPKDSAVMFVKNARAISMAECHRNMVRFSSRDSNAYRKVSRRLAQSAVDAVAFVDKNWNDYDRSQSSLNQLDKYNLTTNLPQQRNPIFVGRDDFLSSVHEKLFESSQQTRSTVVITGIGGVGKSQVVTEYAYLHRSEFSSVFWIDAGSKELIGRSFERISMDILQEHKNRKLEGFDETFKAFELAEGKDKEYRAGQLLREWLSHPDNTQWLIIFDGYDDIEEFGVDEFLPTSNHGHVLITSRRPEAGRLGHALPLDLFSMADGIILLTKSSQTFAATLNETVQIAGDIVHNLGYLPLAIDQAGSYIFARQIELADYLPLLVENFKKVSSRKPKSNWPYGKTLFTTWELSLEAIEQQNPTAVKVLTLCAFLNLEIVTLDIFIPLTDYEPLLYPMGESGASSLTELTDTTWSKYETGEIPNILDAVASFDGEIQENNIQNLEETLELIFTYSLATRRGRNGIAIHPLVLLWARERLSKAEQTQAARDAVVLVGEQNVRATEPFTWMSRGFSQHAHPQLVHCFLLIDNYLQDGLSTSEDWTLILTIERLVMDFVYSKDAQLALATLAFLLIDRLAYRLASQTMILGVLPHIETYIFTRSEPDAAEIGFQQELAEVPFTIGELVVIKSGINRGTNPHDTEFFRKQHSEQATNLEWFRSLLERDPTHELDRISINVRDHGDVRNRMEILHNLARWENELENRFKVQSPDENVTEQINWLHQMISKFEEQCTTILSNRLLDRWLEGPERSSPSIEDFAGRSFHPLIVRWMRTQEGRFPVESGLSRVYKVDYLIQQHECFFTRFWRAAVALDNGRGFSCKVIAEFRTRVKPVLDKVRSLRASSLPKDYCSRSNLPFANGRWQETSTAIYGREAMIEKLEKEVAFLASRNRDPGPCFLEKKWQLIQHLLQLKQEQKEQGVKGVCVDRELFFFIQESFVQMDKTNERTFGEWIHRSRSIRAAMGLQALTLYRLRSMDMCDTMVDYSLPRLQVQDWMD